MKTLSFFLRKKGFQWTRWDLNPRPSALFEPFLFNKKKVLQPKEKGIFAPRKFCHPKGGYFSFFGDETLFFLYERKKRVPARRTIYH